MKLGYRIAASHCLGNESQPIISSLGMPTAAEIGMSVSGHRHYELLYLDPTWVRLATG